MHKCKRCGETKSLEHFYKSATHAGGIFPWCKQCKSAHRKERYALNKKREHELHKLWKINNYEHWRVKHNAASVAWYHANKERASAIKQAYKYRRRSLLEQLESFTLDEWKALCAEYDYRCANCGALDLTVDHVIPLSLGGGNTIENIQPLCGSCNSRKGVQIIDYRRRP